MNIEHSPGVGFGSVGWRGGGRVFTGGGELFTIETTFSFHFNYPPLLTKLTQYVLII